MHWSEPRVIAGPRGGTSPAGAGPAGSRSGDSAARRSRSRTTAIGTASGRSTTAIFAKRPQDFPRGGQGRHRQHEHVDRAVDRFDLLPRDDGRVPLSDGRSGRGPRPVHGGPQALSGPSRLDAADRFSAGIEPKQNRTTIVTWGKSSADDDARPFPGPLSKLCRAGSTTTRSCRRAASSRRRSSIRSMPARSSAARALAISRRREILGPACEHDPLTVAAGRCPVPAARPAESLVAVLGRAGAGPGLCRGQQDAAGGQRAAKVAAGRRAVRSSADVRGAVELGRLAFEQGKYDAAITYFHEATISAAFFERYDVMEEALSPGGAGAPASPARRASIRRSCRRPRRRSKCRWCRRRS